MSTETSARILEELDFTPDLPCEAPDHGDVHSGGAAEWQQRGSCPTCGELVDRLVCDGKRACVLDLVAKGGATRHLTGCGDITRTSAWNLTYTPLPGGAR